MKYGLTFLIILFCHSQVQAEIDPVYELSAVKIEIFDTSNRSILTPIGCENCPKDEWDIEPDAIFKLNGEIVSINNMIKANNHYISASFQVSAKKQRVIEVHGTTR